jgi:conserved oligomeric Golgi complex subunit 6
VAHERTSTVLEEASSLMSERADIETKQRLLRGFHAHFILSDEEVSSLTLTSVPIDEFFFVTLVKAKKISKDCDILLGLEHQTLGLEITDQISKNINLAFQKLYKWIQKELKNLNIENPQMNASIRRAIRVLAERPSLFQNCLDFFAEARERALSDAFYTALTGNSTSPADSRSFKPIEMTAHDPLRYVGDMLAWTHSASVGEREALEIMFVSEGDEIAKGLQSGRENEPWRLVADDKDATPEFDAVKALNELVDRDVSGAARILRQRVEQIIRSNEDTMLAYKLANLLGFYRYTFSRLLGNNSVLLESMISLEGEALRQFRSLIRDHIGALQGEFQQTPSDLGPPEFLRDALKQLNAILNTYDISISASEDREEEFQPVLAEAFEPFISGCENMARNIESPAKHLFIINCRLSAVVTLEPFTFTEKCVAGLKAAVADDSEKLLLTQYLFLCEESGLKGMFDAIDGIALAKKEDIESIRSMALFQPQVLTQASQILDDFLPSALMDAMENLKLLQDSELARQITEEAAGKFCDAFERIEIALTYIDEAVKADSGSAECDTITESLRDRFPRTTGELRVLLS